MKVPVYACSVAALYLTDGMLYAADSAERANIVVHPVLGTGSIIWLQVYFRFLCVVN